MRVQLLQTKDGLLPTLRIHASYQWVLGASPPGTTGERWSTRAVYQGVVCSPHLAQRGLEVPPTGQSGGTFLEIAGTMLIMP